MNIDQGYLHSAALSRLALRALADRRDSPTDDSCDEAILEILADLPFGQAFTFQEQHGGDLVQNLYPVEDHEMERSSRGRAELGLHTDDAFLDRAVRVEYIALCGIENPARIPTEVVAVGDVAERLGEETAETLHSPLFSFGCPESYDIEGRKDMWTPPRPILARGNDGALEVTLPSTSIRVAVEIDPDATHHLQLFKTALAELPRRQVVLEAGEILVISNLRCLHGRPPVVAERWLKRVYLRGDLSTLDEVAATGGRSVYAAARAAAYGR